MGRRIFVCLVISTVFSVSAFAQQLPSAEATWSKASVTESPTNQSSEKPAAAEPSMEQPSIKEVPAENPRAPATMTLDEFLRPTFRVRGLIEAEPVVAAQSAQSKAVIGDLQNGYGFRRVRLGAQGSIGDSARWVSEVELAGGNVQFLDVFIGLTALPVVRELRVGYFREPFSLEGMTGVPFLTFMERSPLNPLDPARNWGIAGYWWPDSERTVLAFGMFRDGTNSAGLSQGDQDAWAYTTRFTGLPIYEPGDDNFRLVHLGMALSQRNPNNGVVSFNPGSGLSLLAVVDNPAIPFLPAVAIPASTQQLYNLQAAYVRGPLSVQSEWFGTTIQQIDAGVVFLHGFYAQASYFLTGEHRGYDRTRGAFSQVKVHHPVIRTRDVPGGGCGAFEVAARYSFYNFSSSNLPPAMDGTSSRALLRQMELEMNWYLNDNTRIMFNYTLPFVDKVDRVATSANVFGIRAALYW